MGNEPPCRVRGFRGTAEPQHEIRPAACQVEFERLVLALLDQLQHLPLDRLVGRLADLVDLANVLQRAGDRAARPVAVEQPRVDVGAAADRRGVAQVAGDLLDRAGDGPVAGGPRAGHRPGGRQRHRRQHGGVPGAEVLGGEVVAGQLVEVVVDVLGADVDPVAAVPPGEQLLTAAAAVQPGHDLTDLRVDHRGHPPLAALARIVEHQRVADHGDLVPAHGGQAVGLVLLGVGLRADPEEAPVEQPHRAGQHPLAGQLLALEVGGHPLAQVRQGPGEVQHAVELLLVPSHPPDRVVQVLAAPRLVGPDRLEVAVGQGADPHVAPGRRDHQ
jgi:hypothetical protein